MINSIRLKAARVRQVVQSSGRLADIKAYAIGNPESKREMPGITRHLPFDGPGPYQKPITL
jgi:hypothetical protein